MKTNGEGVALIRRYAGELELAPAEFAVENTVTVPLNENEFSALVSLVSDIGGAVFKKSGLLFKLNSRDYYGAAMDFRKWNKSEVEGKVREVKVKTCRRLEEAVLFTKRVENEDEEDELG